MKGPRDVGRDFDAYARSWRADSYEMEIRSAEPVLQTDPDKHDQLLRPGDEWGELAVLIEFYRRLFTKLLPGDGKVNVLEIGAGAGRSTQAVSEVLGDRVGEYHVVDVSRELTKHLAERVPFEVQVHVVEDVDVTSVPAHSIDLCLAQSSWSHISLYDQYRYLRDLRGVMRVGATIVVNGIFMIGAGADWTWNRFRRRVAQLEGGIEGVYHEFTGISIIVEALLRLGYEIDAVAAPVSSSPTVSWNCFIARSMQGDPTAHISELPQRPSYRSFETIVDFLDGSEGRLVQL